MLWEVLMVVLIIWLIIRRWKRRKFIALAKLLKNETFAWPFIGHAYQFLGDEKGQMNVYKNLARQSLQNESGMTSFWIGEKLFISIADAEAAEFVARNCVDKGDIVMISRCIFGNGSIFAPVPIWRPRRRIVAPTFNNRQLNHFVSIFAKQSATMAGKIKKMVGQGPFSAWSYITTYTMDAVFETVLGMEVHAQENPNHPFLSNFDEAVKRFCERMTKPWQHNDTIYKLFPSCRIFKKAMDFGQNYIEEVIKTKRQSILSATKQKEVTDDGPKVLKSFLDLIMESANTNSEKSISDVELREELLVILAAGTDTSAVAVCFTLLMLARHPDVQDKVHEEIKEVFGDTPRTVAKEDLPSLKYLEAVIKESLRLYPPVPVIARNIEADVTLPSGITLIKGCEVFLNIYAVHRNPRYWGDEATQYRPERFLDAKLKNPAQFMPFSYGPRNCLGYQYAMMSMKTALSSILMRYRVLNPTPCDPSGPRLELDPITLKADLMMRDVDNFQIRLESKKFAEM